MLGAHAERDALAALQPFTVDVRDQLFRPGHERHRHTPRFDRLDGRIDEVHTRRADKARDEARLRVVIQLEWRTALRDAAEALGIRARMTGSDFTTITGARNTKAPRNAQMITLRRAATTLRVRFNTRSLSTPPAVLPTTPDRNTPAENIAELFRSRPRPCMLIT